MKKGSDEKKKVVFKGKYRSLRITKKISKKAELIGLFA